ncbi:hypothetical protein RvY_07720 [Ramazzottius varieornatus]|uniref:DDE-1 domain-containing protein n=1 Tax=Ramazzottius varieornatus TaxID=947166 RepID=A0A1D1V3B1_RAMVA|nr:hypothetical protein RvY_07720 [Ramazzottius varieornatus]
MTGTQGAVRRLQRSIARQVEESFSVKEPVAVAVPKIARRFREMARRYLRCYCRTRRVTVPDVGRLFYVATELLDGPSAPGLSNRHTKWSWWRKRREKLPGKRGRNKSQQVLDIAAEVRKRIVKKIESKRITRDSDIKKAADQVSKELNLERNVPGTWVWKWKKANGITCSIPTKVGRKTKDTEEDIKAMEKYEAQLEEIHNQLIDPSTIWNMDQTSVMLQNPYRKTSALKGANEVRIVQPPGYKENMAVLLMVAANGTKYPPVIVFKGAKKTGVSFVQRRKEAEHS